MAHDPRSAEPDWEGRDRKAVLHGFADLATLAARGPTVVARGEGVHVYDVHGKRYLEGNSGLWNAIVGFDHPGITETACRQLQRFPAYHAFFGRVTEPAIELAERLLEIAPAPMSKVFFTNSGSEANDTAVKMLWLIARGRGEPARRKIITRHGGYHGVTAITASMTGKDYVKAFGLPLDEFLWTDCPHFWRYGREGESEAAYSERLAANLDALIRAEGPETIAGFFAEPVLGAGGAIPPPAGYFPAVQSVLGKYGIPLVADEVICGLGRTGRLWGSQTYDIRPDIVVTSKCLTAGYFPLGAILVSKEINDALDATSAGLGEFPHGFTTGAHPVGCAIGVKTIDVILNEGVFDNVVEVSPHFLRRLDALSRHPHVGETRGVGLMGAIELVHDKSDGTPFPPEAAIGERIANTALDHGLICRPIGQAIVLAPPFVITMAEIDELFDKLERTMAEVLPVDQ